jgi:glycine amidinotransferase
MTASMRFGAHHEWGKLREVVVGIAPAPDFVFFHEESMRWMAEPAATHFRRHAGKQLIDVDPDSAHRIEQQVEALAALLARDGVTVHRPDPLDGEQRCFMAPNGEGTQLLARDGMIVVGNHVIDGSLRLRCRQRERFGLRPVIQRCVQQKGARWSSVPFGSPAAVDGPFLEGGDVLLNGREIYVGISGCASDLAGADWLESLLGPTYRVIAVPLRSNTVHLDRALALIRPGLLVCCPDRLIDGLPMSLREWDAITVSVAEAELLATDGLVLDEGRMIMNPGNERVIGELRQRRIEVVPHAFDASIAFGGGLRCAHHPLLRESLLE